MTLTAYELERQERMKMIKQRMHSLGLDATLNEINSAVKSQQQARRQVVRPSRSPLTAQQRKQRRLEIRRSNRNAGRPVPNYVLHTASAIEYTPCSRSTRVNRSGSYSRAVMDSKDGWNPSKGLASSGAADAANTAAEALISEIEEKGGHAYAKIMTPSQVSSGFWANAPRGVDSHITFSDKTPISLRLPDGAEDPEDAVHQRDDGTWNCIWLPRPSGAGFSGGWRGFAIDLDLFPADVCVFEIDESSKPAGGGSVDVLIVHVFRAFDYDTDSVREQRKEEAVATAAAVAALEKEEAQVDGEEEDDEDELEFEKEESSDEEEENAALNITRATTGRRLLVSGRAAVSEEESEEEEFEKIEDDEEEQEEEQVPVASNRRNPTKTTTTRKQNKTVAVSKRKRQASPVARKSTSTANANNKKKSTSKKQKKNATPPPAVDKDESSDGEESEEDKGEEFFVEKIIDVKVEDGVKLYYIKWYGYPHSQNTWEPIEMLNAPPESYPRSAGIQL